MLRLGGGGGRGDGGGGGGANGGSSSPCEKTMGFMSEEKGLGSPMGMARIHERVAFAIGWTYGSARAR